MKGNTAKSILRAQILLGQDHAATRAAQGLLGGRRDNLRVRERRRMRAAGDEAGDVRHVHHQQRSHGIGNLAEPREVQHPRIAAAPGYDQPGIVLPRQPLHLVVIDGLSLPVHAVGYEVVELAGKVDVGPVGQVPAHVQLHSQHRVSPGSRTAK